RPSRTRAGRGSSPPAAPGSTPRDTSSPPSRPPWGPRNGPQTPRRSERPGEPVALLDHAAWAHVSILLEDGGEEPLLGRLARGVGEGHGLVDQVVDVLLDGAHIGLAQRAVAEGALAEERDRIAQLLALDLLLGAIHGPRGIAHGMATEPIGPGLDQ